MRKEYKLPVFLVIVFLMILSLVVWRYEVLLKKEKKDSSLFQPVEGGVPSSRKYTAPEIVDLIKNSKEYIGDSVIIYDNGEISSNNGKFRGTLNAVINSEDNMAIVMSNMNANKLPLQYNIYILAATYYRQQYSTEFGSK